MSILSKFRGPQGNVGPMGPRGNDGMMGPPGKDGEVPGWLFGLTVVNSLFIVFAIIHILFTGGPV